MNTLNWVKSRTGVYVTEQGSNSSGRWRRWSDGLLEQWCSYVRSAGKIADFTTFVSFPKAFTTTGYYAFVQAGKNDSNSVYRSVSSDLFGRKTTGVYCGWYGESGNAADSMSIYACGY